MLLQNVFPADSADEVNHLLELWPVVIGGWRSGFGKEFRRRFPLGTFAAIVVLARRLARPLDF